MNLRANDERSLPRTSRFEIIRRILERCKESSGEANLLPICNLGLSQFDSYQSFLVQTGLLEVSETTDEGKIFRASGKGKEFLKDYTQIKGLIETTPNKKEGGEKRFETRTRETLVQDDRRRSRRYREYQALSQQSEIHMHGMWKSCEQSREPMCSNRALGEIDPDNV